MLYRTSSSTRKPNPFWLHFGCTSSIIACQLVFVCSLVISNGVLTASVGSNVNPVDPSVNVLAVDTTTTITTTTTVESLSKPTEAAAITTPTTTTAPAETTTTTIIESAPLSTTMSSSSTSTVLSQPTTTPIPITTSTTTETLQSTTSTTSSETSASSASTTPTPTTTTPTPIPTTTTTTPTIITTSPTTETTLQLNQPSSSPPSSILNNTTTTIPNNPETIALLTNSNSSSSSSSSNDLSTGILLPKPLPGQEISIKKGDSKLTIKYESADDDSSSVANGTEIEYELPAAAAAAMATASGQNLTKLVIKRKKDGTTKIVWKNSTKREVDQSDLGLSEEEGGEEEQPLPQTKMQINDFMPDEIRQHGGIVVHILLLTYVCLCLGIICDIYFLTSIEFIANKLNLPSDIAGATFMALGNSAPELFISLIGVFMTEDDIGTSAILGSAVFNLIFVPSVCGFSIYFSNMKAPKLNKYAVLRDAIFYMISIATLMLAMKDNEIDLIESIAMLMLFFIYICVLYFNAQLGELEIIDDESDMDSDLADSITRSSQTSGDTNESTPLLQSSTSDLEKSIGKYGVEHQMLQSNWEKEKTALGGVGGTVVPSDTIGMRRSRSMIDTTKSALTHDSIRDTRSASVRERSASVRPRFMSMNDEGESEVEFWVESNYWLKIIMMPALFLFRWTIPKANKYSFGLTFMIAIVWISGFTYLAVWLVNIIGYTFQLPETVVGLTILAAGASIPEVISSVIVVKRAGLANMALCNLFGSNIFDILICLGMPWLIKTIINMATIGSMDLTASIVPVQSNGLLLTTFTLLCTVLLFLITLATQQWRIGLGVGIICSIIYFIAISLAAVYEIVLN